MDFDENLSEEAKKEYAYIRSLQRDGIYILNDPEIHEKFLKKCEKKYKDFAERIIQETETDYIQQRIEESNSKESKKVSSTALGSSYDDLISCNIIPGNIGKRYVLKIEKLLENLSAQPELYTELVKEIFKNLHRFKEQVHQKNHYTLRNKKGTAFIKSYKNNQEMIIGAQELVTYLIILSIIIEKRYTLDLEKLSKIQFFLEENHHLEVPLFFAIGGLQDTIIQNTEYKTVSYDYSNIVNPINIVSGYEGKKQISLKELTLLIIKALCTNHRLSDDMLNFPKTKDDLREFKEKRQEQMEEDLQLKSSLGGKKI